jgi:tetratricopeptide (TPR) repeat protein
MSSAARMRILVALIAVTAAGVVAGVVYATRQDPAQPKAVCKTSKALIYPGVPSTHVPAVEAAFKQGAKQAALALEPLTQVSPKDPVVVFNDALALYCAGYPNEAAQAFQQAKKVGANTYYGVKSDNLLHPQYFQEGYPPFVYTGKDPLLIQGQVEQNAYHEQSAEKLWAKDAKLHPESADAQIAAAVGRFDMSDLSASFSRLGPLVKRFPQSQSVSFHLGLLLVWTGQRTQALTEFREAVKLGPQTAVGKQAENFVTRIGSGGSNGTTR